MSARFPGVSTNTAVAALDNGHKVGVYDTASGLVLHVDGQQVAPSSAPDLGPARPSTGSRTASRSSSPTARRSRRCQSASGG